LVSAQRGRVGSLMGESMATAWAAAAGSRTESPHEDRSLPSPGRSSDAPSGPARPTLVFDLESAREVDFSAPWAAGVSVAVVYDACRHEFEIYRGEERRLAVLADRLNSAERVVGFNTERFDFRVLAGMGFPVAPQRSVDLRRLVETAVDDRFAKGNLDDLARLNLNAGKRGRGCDAPRLHQAGEWDRLTEYCMRDVVLTYRLWRHCRAGRPLRLPRGRVVTLPRERL